MPCYILTHRLVKEFSQDEMMECNKRLAAHMPKGAKWQMSWYIPEQNHVICHWDAPGPEVIQQALKASGVADIFPLVKIQEAVEISPEVFKPHKRHARSRSKA